MTHGRRDNVSGRIQLKRQRDSTRWCVRLAGLQLTRVTWLAVFASLLIGCAGPRPVLYPNVHLQNVGKEAADQDIASCREVAKAAGSSPGGGRTGAVVGGTVVGAGVGAASGAAGGAVVGAAGSGSAIGAVSGAVAGLLRGLFRRPPPSQAYMRIVDRCLKERGYEPMGWE
jgi:hypothetical protein